MVMKIATAFSLPLSMPRSSSSPQSKKSKEAMTAYAIKFQDFTKDVRAFVKVLEDAKKATMKSEAAYQQVIAQTSLWTSSLSNETLNHEEIARLELNLREKMVDFEKDYDEEVLKQARKFKISTVNEIQKALKSGREAWAGVAHYENKVKNLGKKLERLDGAAPQKIEMMEEKLDRNEKKLLQSTTIASQWDQELKRCALRVDQSWITILSLMKDFTEFDVRNNSEISKMKSKIDELIEEDVAYSQEMKMKKQPLSILVEETERTSKYNSGISAMSLTTATTSMENDGLSLPFKKKNKSKKETSVKSSPNQPVAVDDHEEDEDDKDIIECDQPMDSYFSKADSAPEPVAEKSEDSDDEVYIVEEPKEPDSVKVESAPEPVESAPEPVESVPEPVAAQKEYFNDAVYIVGEPKEPEEDDITV